MRATAFPLVGALLLVAMGPGLAASTGLAATAIAPDAMGWLPGGELEIVATSGVNFDDGRASGFGGCVVVMAPGAGEHLFGGERFQDHEVRLAFCGLNAGGARHTIRLPRAATHVVVELQDHEPQRADVLVPWGSVGVLEIVVAGNESEPRLVVGAPGYVPHGLGDGRLALVALQGISVAATVALLLTPLRRRWAFASLAVGAALLPAAIPPHGTYLPHVPFWLVAAVAAYAVWAVWPSRKPGKPGTSPGPAREAGWDGAPKQP